MRQYSQEYEVFFVACIILKINSFENQKIARSSYKERKGNALASGAEEGRDKLR